MEVDFFPNDIAHLASDIVQQAHREALTQDKQTVIIEFMYNEELAFFFGRVVTSTSTDDAVSVDETKELEKRFRALVEKKAVFKTCCKYATLQWQRKERAV